MRLEAAGKGQTAVTRAQTAAAHKMVFDHGFDVTLRPGMWAARTGFERGYQFDFVGDDDETKAMKLPRLLKWRFTPDKRGDAGEARYWWSDGSKTNEKVASYVDAVARLKPFKITKA